MVLTDTWFSLNLHEGDVKCNYIQITHQIFRQMLKNKICKLY